MNGPHDAKSRAADLIERFTPCGHLPQNDAPAEHVAFLRVVAACNHETGDVTAVFNRLTSDLTHNHNYTTLRYHSHAPRYGALAGAEEMFGNSKMQQDAICGENKGSNIAEDTTLTF